MTVPPPGFNSNSFRLGLAGLVAAMGLVQALAVLGWLETFWGFHLTRFAPTMVGGGAWLGLLVVLAILLRPDGIPHPLRRAGRSLLAGLERHRLLSVLAFTASAGIVFWVLRSQQTLLGDTFVIQIELPKGEPLHPRQPLTKLLQLLVFEGFAPLFRGEEVPQVQVVKDAIALGSVLAGIAFVPVALALGRRLAPDAGEVPGAGWLLGLVLLLQGYTQLYFGYVEHYTFSAFFIALYLLLGVGFLQGSWPSWPAGLALVVAIGLHLANVVFLPSWGVLAFVGYRRGGRVAALRDATVTLAAFATLDVVLRRVAMDYSLGVGLRDLFASAGGDVSSRWRYLLSLEHGRDFVNEHHLVGPLAGSLFVLTFLVMIVRRRRPTVVVMFLAAAATVFLAAAWLTHELPLGYARDWDVFAPGLAILGVVVPHADLRSVLTAAVILSAGHVACWVTINASESRAAERFSHLPLDGGRTEMVLANWHLREDRAEEARVWLEKALVAEPGLGAAHYSFGILHARAGRWAEAALHLEQACEANAERPVYHRAAIEALRRLQRLPDTLPHHAALCELEPHQVQNWVTYARQLDGLGRRAESTSVLLEARSYLRAQLQLRPENPGLLRDAGIVLANLGAVEESLRHLDQALAADPGSATALLTAIDLLINGGRSEQAVPYVRRFLHAHPSHARSVTLREWLTGQRAP